MVINKTYKTIDVNGIKKQLFWGYFIGSKTVKKLFLFVAPFNIFFSKQLKQLFVIVMISTPCTAVRVKFNKY